MATFYERTVICILLYRLFFVLIVQLLVIVNILLGLIIKIHTFCKLFVAQCMKHGVSHYLYRFAGFKPFLLL